METSWSPSIETIPDSDSIPRQSKPCGPRMVQLDNRKTHDADSIRQLEKGRAAPLFFAFAGIFALVGRGAFYSSDEAGIFNTAVAIAESGSMAIGPGEGVHIGHGGQNYSRREILPILATIPFVELGKIFGVLARGTSPPVADGAAQFTGTNWPVFVCVTLIGPLLSAATVVLIYLFVIADGGSRSAALSFAVAAALGTPLIVYSKTIFAQVFESAFLMGAFLAARRWRDAPSSARALEIAIACALSVLSRPSSAPAALCFLCLIGFAGSAPASLRFRCAALFLLTVSIAASAVGWINFLRWGSPIDFGYHEPEFTFSTSLPVGVFGLLASPGKCVFLYAPALVVPVIFARRLWRHGPPEFLLALATTAAYLAVYSRWSGWHGDLAWGPRFIVPLVAPWLAIGARAFRAAPSPHRWVWLVVPTLIGGVIQCLGLAVYIQWINALRPDPFELTASHLVATVRAIAEHGVDDLWIWSLHSTSSTGRGGLMLMLLGVVLVAANLLHRRASASEERWCVRAIMALTAILVLGSWLR